MKKYITIAAVLLVSNSWAKEDVNGSTSPPLNTPSGVSCAQPTSSVDLDINNVRTKILNGGDMWWDQGGDNNARYEIPKLNSPNAIKKNALFAGSVWIGGHDGSGSNIFVTAQTYRQNNQASYWPGPLVYDATNTTSLPSIDATECTYWDKHFKVNKSTIENFINDYGDGKINSEGDVPDEILSWPGRGNPFMDDQNGAIDLDRELAPFYDEGELTGTGNGIYNPLEGDYPRILGDQAIWWVMNDVGDEKNFNSTFFSISDKGIGLELETMAFAFQSNDEINNMTFYQQKMTNKGFRTLFDTYIGQWVDPDLGNYVDDYVGCDVTRGLGICYNGDDDDDGVLGYGLNPPAIGVDFFEGPLADFNDGVDNDRDGLIDEGTNGIDDDGQNGIDDDAEREKIVMSNFLYYNNNANAVNGNPTGPQSYYNYLQSKWINGDDVMYDGLDGTDQSVNNKAKFMFPGTTDQEFYWGTDHIQVDPWDEVSAGNAPADRRFLQSAGPFTLEPGQINTVTVGVIWMRAGSGGATGSIAALKIADDKAQALFDDNFKELNGPNPPDVAVTEMDQEIVFALTPSEFFVEGIKTNTEAYKELKPSLVTEGAAVAFFKFQGYLVYQLKDNKVSPGDVGNTDLARLIAQCDIKDGVANLINMEANPLNTADGAARIEVLKVEGEDEGVFHTMTIKLDMFNSGKKIVNNKEYYFIVKAYASNTDPVNLTQQFIDSKKGVNVITAIPHLTSLGGGGVILNSEYGTGIDVTSKNGTGTGDVSIDFTDATVATILKDNKIDEPTYEGGAAPIAVKVYDPISVKAGTFKVNLYSRLLLDYTSSLSYKIGDLIEAVDTVTDENIAPASFDNNEIGATAIIKDILEPIEVQYDSSYSVSHNEFIDTIFDATLPGSILITTPADTSIIIDSINTSVVPPDTILDTIYVAEVSFMINGGYVFETTPAFIELVTETKSRKVAVFKVVVQNDQEGGTFSKHIRNIKVDYIISANNPPVPVDVFKGYAFYNLPVLSNGISSNSYGFILHDYFEITDTKNDSIQDYDKHYSVSEFNEVLITKYNSDSKEVENVGVTLQMKHGYDPVFEVFDRSDNGFIEATFNLETGSDWLRPIAYDPIGIEGINWLTKITPTADVEAGMVDPTGVYKRIANGSIAPYSITNLISSDGPRYPSSNGSTEFKDLSNIDIVIDYDNKDNWTRVPVIQTDFIEGANGFDNKFSFNKSELPSIGKNGTVDGSTSPNSSFGKSAGMGWFPGYAIDLDKGIRLNMMFSESKTLDLDNGNNLVWEPTKEKHGGKSFIYVGASEYDPTFYEEKFDNGALAFLVHKNSTTFGDSMVSVFNDIAWVVNARKTNSQAIGSGNYKIKIRVNHYFKTTKVDKHIPEYMFSTDKYVPTVGDKDYLNSLLDLIRAVPNPYYAYSEYETDQINNAVRITNLPIKCKVSIYTVSGLLVRSFNKNDNNPFLQWDLKNEFGLPIASGAYLIHIDAGEIGEKVIKWFGVNRPLQIDSF